MGSVVYCKCQGKSPGGEKEMKDYIAMVRSMINTGASKKVVWEFVENLYKDGKVSTRTYELLVGMINDKQGA